MFLTCTMLRFHGLQCQTADSHTALQKCLRCSESRTREGREKFDVQVELHPATDGRHTKQQPHDRVAAFFLIPRCQSVLG
jgi:hypothetical protein